MSHPVYKHHLRFVLRLRLQKGVGGGRICGTLRYYISESPGHCTISLVVLTHLPKLRNKYLGFWLNEHLDFSHHLTMLLFQQRKHL